MQDARHAHQPVIFGIEVIADVIDVVAHEQELAGLDTPALYDFRGILFDAIDRPCSETWDRAHNLVLLSPGDAEPISLWSAVVYHTSYDYRDHFPGQKWPVVPSPAQILQTLSRYHRNTSLQRKPREAAPWETPEMFF